MDNQRYGTSNQGDNQEKFVTLTEQGNFGLGAGKVNNTQEQQEIKQRLREDNLTKVKNK